MKIVYCIDGLFNSGGMERVLVNKANYFVKKFGYEIIIITTDQKNKEIFYELNSKIKTYDLGINYSDDENKNFIQRIYFYLKKNRIHKCDTFYN